MAILDHASRDARTRTLLTRATRHIAQGMLLIGMCVLGSACGGCNEPDEQVDACKTTTCERGQCDSSNGMCVNPDACDGDDTRCLEGYSCQDDDTCQADVACAADSTCVRGTCMAGACVSPETCAADIQCVEGSICEAGACIKDLCADKTCERGVCARTSGECVNATTCTETQESTQCVDGFKCDAQQCVDETTFCDRLACTRGVCDFDSKSCVDATDCGGADSSCLLGNFCNEANTCMTNICNADGSTCMGGGECVRATGECVNPEVCAASSECLPMNLCVSGRCVEEATACGAEGCVGNQTCTYDASALEATCTENTLGCATAVDCTGDRVCDAGVCGPGTPCSDDEFEPNNAADEATVYAEAQVVGAVSASVCSGDVDLYTFDTTQDSSQGVLLVNLDYAPADLGLGTLKVELLSPAGTVVEQADADAQGKVRLRRDIGLVSGGVYTIRVSDAGDVSNTGVSYSLYVDVVDQTAITACTMPEILAEGDMVTSTTISGESTALRSTCADLAGVAAEDIYQIDIATPSYITIMADAAAQGDVAVSLRSECLSDRSEFPGACADAGELDATETINALVEPGSYFIVVQGGDSSKGGSYTVSWSREDVTCTQADTVCVDQDTSSVCRRDGSAFDTIECGVGGCNSGTGRCNRPQGDLCIDAPVITKAMSPFVSASFLWSDLSSDYDPGSGACVPADAADESVTDGADISYQVVVPSNHGLNVTLTPDMMSGQDVSLYLVRDCLSTSACEPGSNRAGVNGVETLSWFNSEATAQTVYVIADSKQGVAMGSATVQIEVNEVLCSMGDLSCVVDPATNIDSSGTCNTFGTGYENFVACNFGCDASTGLCNPPTNDVCANPLALTSGVSITETIDVYSNDHNVDSSSDACNSVTTSGGDAVYSIDALAGDVITATVDSTFNSVIWISGACDAASNVLSQCLGVSNSGNPEKVVLVAPADGTYFVTVAAVSSFSSSGTFTLTASAQAPQCVLGTTPAQCSSNGLDLEFCNAFGVFDTYTCQNGVCSNGACDPPIGDVCADSITLNPAGQTTGMVSGSYDDADGTNFLELPAGTTGQCLIDAGDASDGTDTFYTVTLAAGDLLTLDLQTTNSGAQLFIFDSCQDVNSCLSNLRPDGPGVLNFIAPTAGTYTVMVDSSLFTATQPYTMTWSIVTGAVCLPDSTFCADPTTVQICDATGQPSATTYTCATSCTDGRCDVMASAVDMCDASAPFIQGGTVVTLNYDDLTNDIDMSTATSCTGVQTDGPDAFFNVEVPANSLLSVEVENQSTSSVEEAQLYVITDCANPAGTCLAGVEEDYLQQKSTLFWTNTGATRVVTVGIDNESTSVDDDITVFIRTRPLDCTPGDSSVTSCVDASTLRYCNTLGIFETTTCQNNGVCTGTACEQPTGDVCIDSIPLTSGVLVSGNNSANTANNNVVGGTCATTTTSGRDVVYSIDAQAGQVLTAQIPTASINTILWVSSECGTANEAGVASCLGVENISGNGGELVQLVVPTTGTYYVTVSSTSSTTSGSGTFDLLVTVQAPQCTPGDPAQCSNSGAEVEFCNGQGVFDTYACQNNGLCTNGACEQPTGDVCADGLPLNTPGQTLGTVTGSFDDANGTNSLELPVGTSGQCTIDSGDASDGVDTFYTIDLLAGDLLELDLVTTSLSGQIYVFERCVQPDTCQVNLRPDGSGIIYFQAPLDGTYSIMVDNSSSFATQTYTLNWRIITGAVCLPNQPYCQDAATAALCDAAGTGAAQTFACTNGCVNETCDVMASAVDMCDASAPFIQGGTVVTLNYDDLTNDIDMSTAASCTGVQTDGPDAFFNVEVPANSLLSVEVENQSTSSVEEAQLYVITDCANPAGTCLAGVEEDYLQQKSTLFWTNTGATRVVTVGIDNESPTVDDDITVLIRTRPLDCTPGDSSVTGCVDASTLRYCNTLGIFETYTCQGNNVCTNDACAQPTGDACIDPFILNAPGVTSGSFTGSYDDADGTNSLELPAGQTSSCFIDSGDASDGTDTFYAVELLAGDLLSLDLQTTNSGAQLFIFETCLLTDTCLTNLRPDGAGVLNFVAPTSGTYTVMVDSSLFTATQPYTLNWSVTPGALCAPDTFFCADSTTASLCDSTGSSSLYSYSCAAGCAAGACSTTSADIDLCATTLGTINADTLLSIDWNTLTNDIDLASPNCTASQTDGPDAFFTVFLQPNETLAAAIVSPNVAGIPQLYVLDDCASSAASNTCLQGDSGDDAALSWTNTTGAALTVRLGIDNQTSTGLAGSVEVEVTITP